VFLACKDNTMHSDHVPILCHVDDDQYIETASLPKWKLYIADWKRYREGCNVAITSTGFPFMMMTSKPLTTLFT